MGFFFGIQVPPLDILCAMKFSAILARQKGHDFYVSFYFRIAKESFSHCERVSFAL